MRTMVLTRFVPLAVLGALAACTVGPDYHAPEPVLPAALAAPDGMPTAMAPVEHWWIALGDEPLSGLIDAALAGSPDLASAEARVQQARAQARVTGAALYPTLNADGRVSRDKLSRNGENLALIPFTPPRTEFTDYRIGVDAAWEIDLAGKTRRDVESAVARLGSATETRNDARAVLAAEVAGAYVDYRLAGARLALAEANLAGADEVLRLNGLQQQAGWASVADGRRAAADREASLAAVAPLTADRDAALIQLGVLTGLDPGAVRQRVGGTGALPRLPDAVPVGLPADVLRRRPDVRRAERDLAAATADVGSATAAQFPRLTLVGDFGWDSVHSGELTSAASRYWNFGPQLSVPLFAGGRLRAQTEAASAGRDAALAGYRATVLRALGDAETTIVRYAAERHRLAALTGQAAALHAAAELERLRFQAGESSRVESIGADHAERVAADVQLVSEAQALRAYAALGKALGCGWQAP